MKGFVLAAGLGERLRPITETVPKPLLPVGNVPLIGYALRLLAHHGITDIIVNVHHLARSLREGLGSGERFGVKITYSVEKEILGTGGGLKKMHEALGSETFVVVNSDTVMDLDLGALLAEHRSRGALATMVLRADERQEEFGQIEVDGSGRIQRILGHARPGANLEGLRSLMFAGVHVLEPRFLDYIPPDVNTCVVRYAYTKALDNDETLHSVESRGYWADAGTPARYFDVNADALAGRIRMRHIDPLAVDGVAALEQRPAGVFVDDDVQVGEDVVFHPPVLLGHGAKVAAGAEVGPGVVVGARAQIGKKALVREAVLLGGVRIAAKRHVERQLVGRQAVLDLPGPRA